QARTGLGILRRRFQPEQGPDLRPRRMSELERAPAMFLAPCGQLGALLGSQVLVPDRRESRMREGPVARPDDGVAVAAPVVVVPVSLPGGPLASPALLRGGRFRSTAPRPLGVQICDRGLRAEQVGLQVGLEEGPEDRLRPRAERDDLLFALAAPVVLVP